MYESDGGFGAAKEIASFVRIYSFESAVIFAGIVAMLAVGGDLITHEAWPAIPIALLFAVMGYVVFEDPSVPTNMRVDRTSNKQRLLMFIVGAEVGLIVADMFSGRTPDGGEAILLLAIVIGYALAAVALPCVKFAGAIKRLFFEM